MLNIAVVQVGNYCGLGREYTAQLLNGVRRNLQGEYRLCCMTDDPETLPDGVECLEHVPGLQGWWNKVALFKPGMFPDGDRVLFFDLDQVITGSLEGFAAYRGSFAIVRDYYGQHMNSSVMAWEAGTLNHIWTRYDDAGRPQGTPGGDQTWIQSMQPKADYWQEMLPGQIVSYRAYCSPLGGIPPTVRILSFHGRPRPHEAMDKFYLPLKPVEFSTTAPSQKGTTQ